MDSEIIEIFVCPACLTKVDLVKDSWFVCRNPDCRRKYPILEDIPVFLIEEGDKYVDVGVEDLDISRVTFESVGK